MDFSSIKKLSIDEVKDFVGLNNVSLDSKVHQYYSKEQMLEYIQNNFDSIFCSPVYYYGDTIIAIRIEENINGQEVISYWNVTDF